MKTLQHHVLIFDDDCPLCEAYTSAFIKTKMLDANGREAYGEMSANTCNLIDKDRARNEIALVNTKTGVVLYGIDSLMRVLAHSWPVFAPLFRWNLFRWLMKHVYAFISYNRKVIIPAVQKQNACVPDVNLFYRWAYIVFTWLFTSMVLSKYSVILNGVIPPSKFFREFMICGGQIVFQSVTLFFITPKKRLDYLGNMMTISFAGALLLLIVLGFAKLGVSTGSVFYAVVFMGVASLMFIEHWRRMKVLQIHWLASVSWVVYRLLILSFILN